MSWPSKKNARMFPGTSGDGHTLSSYMIGTQFHPEADATGMSMYLQREDKKKTVIAEHGEEKWRSMIEQLDDPDKIRWTYSHVIPNFLDNALKERLAKKLVNSGNKTSPMVPTLRAAYNKAFTPQQYEAFLKDLKSKHPGPSNSA